MGPQARGPPGKGAGEPPLAGPDATPPRRCAAKRAVAEEAPHSPPVQLIRLSLSFLLERSKYHQSLSIDISSADSPSVYTPVAVIVGIDTFELNIFKRSYGTALVLAPSTEVSDLLVQQDAVGESRDTGRNVGGGSPSQSIQGSPSNVRQEVVLYRGAPWIAPVGNWLSSCHELAELVEVKEPVPSKRCLKACSNGGHCNLDTGACSCPSGYAGPDCGELEEFPCNLPPIEEYPFGRWIVSVCPASCDARTAHCFCGEGTKYPDRPVVSPCGFLKGKDGIYLWKEMAPRDDLFGNSTKTPGWCNADPEEVATGQQQSPLECPCTYDGQGGAFCEHVQQSFCLNQCSGNGFCNHGYCHVCPSLILSSSQYVQCEEGWYGVDCSTPTSNPPKAVAPFIPPWLIPSSSPEGPDGLPTASGKVEQHSSQRRLLSQIKSTEAVVQPRDLQASTTETGGHLPDAKSIEGRLLREDPKARKIKRQRPLIYVYNLPPKFHAHILQGRQWRFYCASRQYTEDNHTAFSSYLLHGLETAVTEGFLASKHRTTNANEADYFFVSILGGCAVIRGFDSPRQSIKEERKHLRVWAAAELYQEALEYIRSNYTYWDKHGGKDHIWVFPWDEGACMAPRSIWPSILLSHWGNTNTVHKNHTTAYASDKWGLINDTFRGDHPCFDPEKDIVLPAWKAPDMKNIQSRYWARPLEERTKLFYFNGNLGSKFTPGRPEPEYSMGIRQAVAEHFASAINNEGVMGTSHQEDIVVTHERHPEYGREISSSKFCGVFPGDGFSARMEDAILHGCIPVIIQDGIQLPFENVLDFNGFTVRIGEADIPRMADILRSKSDEEVAAMLALVRANWQRFSWHSVIRLEADRQRELYGHVPFWAEQLSALTEDDALTTLIQILHYKLHNDKWRREVAAKQRRAARTYLPAGCN
eukprot:SM000046S16445  [mRNA]  locus=s46:710421:716713:- [translate_table: standard]